MQLPCRRGPRSDPIRTFTRWHVVIPVGADRVASTQGSTLFGLTGEENRSLRRGLPSPSDRVLDTWFPGGIADNKRHPDWRRRTSLNPWLARDYLESMSLPDTLQADRFVELMKRDRLADGSTGWLLPSAAGPNSIKVNAVLMRGINDDEAVDLLRFCGTHGYQLDSSDRCLDPCGWSRDRMITADEIQQQLDAP